MAKNSDKLVYQQDGVYNGVLASNQIDKARTISLGIKLGVQWHFKNSKIVPLEIPWMPEKKELIK